VSSERFTDAPVEVSHRVGLGLGFVVFVVRAGLGFILDVLGLDILGRLGLGLDVLGLGFVVLRVRHPAVPPHDDRCAGDAVQIQPALGRAGIVISAVRKQAPD
jgi:hypothetical protein